MTLVSRSKARLGAVALTAMVALAACTTATSTTLVVYMTPAPTATVAQTPTAKPTPTAVPTPASTASAPAPQPTATAPAATAAPTGAPAPSSSPSATAGPASGCSGTAAHQEYFASAASQLPFDVYCGVLPSSWWLKTTSYTLPNGGHLDIAYTNSAGSLISMAEGNICKAPMVCASFGLDIGAANFGSVAGRLYQTESGNYMISVGPISNPSYVMSETGVTKAQFVSIAAALFKVAKS